MRSINLAGWDVPHSLSQAAIVALAILVALAVHIAVMAVARRLAGRSDQGIDDAFVRYARRPARWIMVVVALGFVRRPLRLDAGLDALWNQSVALIGPLLAGWFVINMIRAYGRSVELRFDITTQDNLYARRRRTRAAILGRIAIVTVGFVTVALMLLSIPSIRAVGVTLMASAGLAGLAVGAAAQPALKNLIAGVQMAFTEPIRIDDVVIIDSEWGKIEEIRLTYVVVALWDERRLIVPVSKFLEQSFQNWTRSSSQLLGSAFLYLDPTADIAKLRARYEAIVTEHPLFDGRAQVMQVTDVKDSVIEVRVLATARDAGETFDLRCAIREAMLAFIRDEMPDALPRTRIATVGQAGASAPGAAIGIT